MRAGAVRCAAPDEELEVDDGALPPNRRDGPEQCPGREGRLREGSGGRAAGRGERGGAGHVPPGQGPRVGHGVRGRPRGRIRPHRLRRRRGRPSRGAQAPLRGPHPGLAPTPLFMGPPAAHGDRPATERDPSPWLAAVARVPVPGPGRPAPGQAGRRIAELRADSAADSGAQRPRFSRTSDSSPGRLGQPPSMSTNSGAWSEGFCPLRAFRSMSP